MPPVQATIAITPGVGQFLDAVSMTIGANLVVRETMVLADPTSPTELAAVSGGALAVFLPTAQITTLTPPTASAIASAIVANPPTTFNGIVTNSGTFAVQATLAAETTKVIGTVNQGTSPWVVSTTFSAPQHVIVDSGTITGITNPVAVTGTFFQATQPVSIASGQVASGAFASGSIASGAIAAGAAAAGAFADGSVFVRSNAAATFPVTATIAAAQTIAVTNAGTFAVQQVPGIPTTGTTLRTNGTTSSSGWTSVVAAGGGSQTVRLWRLVVSVSAATNIEIGDGTNVFLGPYYFQANGSITLDMDGEPWCVTGANAALEINNSNAVAVTYTTWTTQS